MSLKKNCSVFNQFITSEYSEFVFFNSIDSIFFCWLQSGRKKTKKVAKF